MRRKPSPPDPAPRSALARLLEVESRLEAMLAEARREGDALLRDAEIRATTRIGSLEAELVAADAELSARLAAAAEGRIRAEASVVAARCARFEALEPADLSVLADWVVEQVLLLAAEDIP